MSEYITVSTPAGVFGAYLARPQIVPAPAVVVLHEVFGVNADMRLTCDELAAQGFMCASFANLPHWMSRSGPDRLRAAAAAARLGVACGNRSSGVFDDRRHVLGVG